MYRMLCPFPTDKFYNTEIATTRGFTWDIKPVHINAHLDAQKWSSCEAEAAPSKPWNQRKCPEHPLTFSFQDKQQCPIFLLKYLKHRSKQWLTFTPFQPVLAFFLFSNIHAHDRILKLYYEKNKKKPPKIQSKLHIHTDMLLGFFGRHPDQVAVSADWNLAISKFLCWKACRIDSSVRFSTVAWLRHRLISRRLWRVWLRKIWISWKVTKRSL